MFLTPPKARFSSTVGNGLFHSASLDLQFAKRKSLVDATTGQNLVTFTRASSGTYVDSQGVIRTATTNLLLRSEEFDNASWAKTNTAVASNQTVSPGGTTTADLLTNTTATQGFTQQNVTVGDTTAFYTFSVFVKSNGAAQARVLTVDAASSGARLTFTFATETVLVQNVGTNGTGAAGSFVKYADGWYRLIVTGRTTAAGTVRLSQVSCAKTAYGTSDEDGTSGIYLWGAQLEQSSTVGEYIPTTSTINSAPRFDHNPTTGESLGLLVEEQRTNLCLQSEDFSTTWGTTNYTVTTNATTAPNGTVTADKLIRNTTDTTTSVTQNVTVTANTAYNYSIFVKASEWSKVGLREGSVSGNYVTFDLSSGTIVSSSVAIGAITAFANGWYRISMQMTTGAAQTTYGIRLIPLPNSYTSGTPSYSFAGDGTSGVFAWGAQLEAGSGPPTSYIPTTTSAVTRAADVASITGTAFSSWYGINEHTIFVDFAGTNIASGQFPRIAELNDGTGSNFIRLQQYSNNVVRASVTTGGAVQFAADNGTVFAGVRGKTAFGFAVNDAALVTNGSLPTTDTSYLIPTGISQLGIGGPPGGSTSIFNSTIRRLTYWPQRLSNNVLQSITQ